MINYSCSIKINCQDLLDELSGLSNGYAFKSIHFWKNESLALRSPIYEPKGFNEGYDLPIHNSGTLPLNRAFEAA